MQKKFTATALLLSILAVSWTNQELYDTMQSGKEVECLKVPDSQYDDCMAAAKKPYEVYQEERKETRGK